VVRQSLRWLRIEIWIGGRKEEEEEEEEEEEQEEEQEEEEEVNPSIAIVPEEAVLEVALYSDGGAVKAFLLKNTKLDDEAIADSDEF
jgi:hypothetical protein